MLVSNNLFAYSTNQQLNLKWGIEVYIVIHIVCVTIGGMFVVASIVYLPKPSVATKLMILATLCYSVALAVAITLFRSNQIVYSFETVNSVLVILNWLVCLYGSLYIGSNENNIFGTSLDISTGLVPRLGINSPV
jgi:hypothetical protein